MSKQQLNDLDFQNVSRILNLLDPTLAQHAATKNYVDLKRIYSIETSTLSSTSNTTLTNLSEMLFNLINGDIYEFEFYIRFQTAINTTGIVLSLNATSFSFLNALVLTPVAADGTAGVYHGQISSSGDVVVGTGVAVANTPALALIKGIIQPSSNISLIPQFRSEVNGSSVTVLPNSVGILRKLN